MVKGAVVEAAPVTAAAAAAAGSWVYPAALLAAPLIRLAEDYFEHKELAAGACLPAEHATRNRLKRTGDSAIDRRENLREVVLDDRPVIC